MTRAKRFRRPGETARAAGFTVIEVVVAAAILFVVAIGLIPLFQRSLISNKQGSDATRASQIGISRVEQLYQLDFGNPALDPGTTDEYLSRTDGLWHAGTAPSTEVVAWARATTVQEFTLSDLDDDGQFNDPLPPGTDPVFIHLKEVAVTVTSMRDPGSPLGVRRPLFLRTLKPF